MSRRRLAIIGLGLAVKPHALSLLDLKDRVEVPPGESTTITVTWTPEFAAEDFSKGASIWTNDPALFAEGSQSKDGKILFEVKGDVIDGCPVPC